MISKTQSNTCWLTHSKTRAALAVTASAVCLFSLFTGACLLGHFSPPLSHLTHRVKTFGGEAVSSTAFTVGLVAAGALALKAYQQKTKLQYKDLSPKNLHLIDLPGHLIVKQNGWIAFGLDPKASQKDKIHISIECTMDNMSKAFDVILPLLLKYKVPMFKIMNREVWENPHREADDNSDGKEFAFCVSPSMNQEDLTSLLREIHAGLTANHVNPGNPSQADLPIRGGGHYFYTRASHNAFGNYIPASHLHQLGFTLTESAYLGESRCLNLNLGEDDPKPIAQAPKPSVTRALPSYKDQVRTYLRLLIRGENRRRGVKYSPETQMFLEKFPQLEEQLKPLVEKAFSILKRTNLIIHDGSIIPALYHQFLMPLLANHKAGKPLQLSSEQERALVIAMCKSALRDGPQTTPNPVYVNNRSEEEVSQVVNNCYDEVSRNGSDH